MVHLTRIYTKTGDDGSTALGDMSRTSKNDPRLEAYATVDEANSSIGVALAMSEMSDDVRKLLVRIQNDLFDVGADLCTPVIDNPGYEQLRVLDSQVAYLEEQIDKFNADLAELRSFVLPSGTPAAALLHVARTVVRRAERRTWSAIHAFGTGVNRKIFKSLIRFTICISALCK
jgi:cob(I)alamin adenosyltransferase